MERTLAISDIHGCLREFDELLNEASYNPDRDHLVLLGDYVDRGPDSAGAVGRVMELARKYGAVPIGGNHDDMFLGWLDDESREEEDWYFSQGGEATALSYCEEHGIVFGACARERIRDRAHKHVSFLRALPDYFEDDSHIFVHAGVDLYASDWRESSQTDFKWIRQMFWNAKNETGKTIVFGHTPTTFFHLEPSHDPFHFPEGGRIAIDGGCVFGNQLNCLIIAKGEDGPEYSFKSVQG